MIPKECKRLAEVDFPSTPVGSGLAMAQLEGYIPPPWPVPFVLNYPAPSIT